MRGYSPAVSLVSACDRTTVMQEAGLMFGNGAPYTEGLCSSPAGRNLSGRGMHCQNSACLLYHLHARPQDMLPY